MSVSIKSMVNPETMTINRDALVLIINEFRKVDVAPLSMEEFNKKVDSRLGHCSESIGANPELSKVEACIMAEYFNTNLKGDILRAFNARENDNMQRNFLNRNKNSKPFSLTVKLINNQCLVIEKTIEAQELLITNHELAAARAKKAIEESEEEIRGLKEDARALNCTRW